MFSQLVHLKYLLLELHDNEQICKSDKIWNKMMQDPASNIK